MPCLQAPETTQWCLLYFEAWSSQTWAVEGLSDLSEYDNEVNQSPNGIIVTLHQVHQLAQAPTQIINLVLAGSAQAATLHRYEQPEQLYACCDYVLEVVDSSYLLVHSSDQRFIECLRTRLEGVKTVL
ncbi:hypothetical protein [Hymenobacter volaticus]|uniref:Uncharacterized protein n=1 Tax=Hymenobacter volaticus TaxID=2932254 RepID=A0ABY4GFA8_9BACT|nr:hypothetical protein [Hymenobacter volaticus]UOQ69506.1 hypothetical protein MUN86_28090 [Hymenobacter volaticus]